MLNPQQSQKTGACTGYNPMILLTATCPSWLDQCCHMLRDHIRQTRQIRKVKILVLVQAVESSKQAGTGDWSSRFRSFLVHSAQLTHLDSLLASTSQPATVAPQPVGMAPFLDISSSPSKQVSMLKAWTAFVFKASVSFVPSYAVQEIHVCRQCRDSVASCCHVPLQQQVVHTASTAVRLLHRHGQLCC